MLPICRMKRLDPITLPGQEPSRVSLVWGGGPSPLVSLVSGVSQITPPKSIEPLSSPGKPGGASKKDRVWSNSTHGKPGGLTHHSFVSKGSLVFFPKDLSSQVYVPPKDATGI